MAKLRHFIPWQDDPLEIFKGNVVEVAESNEGICLLYGDGRVLMLMADSEGTLIFKELCLNQC